MFVEQWEKETRNFRKQNARETTYSVNIDGDEKLFQIQTYGEDGKTSGVKQIIQFNKDRARELIDILKVEFNL